MTYLGRPQTVLAENSASGVGSPAAETAILVTDAVNAQTGAQTVVKVYMNVTAGTGATALVVRCRQGNGTTGTQVGPAFTYTLAAGNTASIGLCFRDPSGWLEQEGGGQYTITVAETGATANGTVNDIYTEVCQ
jgi:hypothetical protein